MKLIIHKSGGDVDIAINPPEIGYQVELQMAISIVELSNKKYGMWDNGIAYDTNILRVNSLLLDPTAQKYLSDALTSNDPLFTMTLDLESNRGFYPAGPHHGDSGTFDLKLISRDTSEWLDDPYGYFRNTLEFTVKPNQTYTIPSLRTEGTLSIGEVTGLRYPPEGFRIKNKYAYEAITGHNNNTSGIDDGSDVQECNFYLICNNENAANLINFITGVDGRINRFNLVSQSNYYSFGIENGSSGTYPVKILKQNIIMTHENDSFWSIPLSFWGDPV
ncbi:MAG TPA: hypothetical protein VFM18_08145 [Methanosarcina sp.]|nr:hypothetical protein [Methanosarcina sp.]